MPAHPAFQIVIKALTLRTKYPDLPALEVLDEAMRGHRGPLNFGNLGIPPSPFAQLVSEAFEPVIGPREWGGLLSPQHDPAVRQVLLDIWEREVWPQFKARYDLF